jgi:hypothetical protein
MEWQKRPKVQLIYPADTVSRFDFVPQFPELVQIPGNGSHFGSLPGEKASEAPADTPTGPRNNNAFIPHAERFCHVCYALSEQSNPSPAPLIGVIPHVPT